MSSNNTSGHIHFANSNFQVVQNSGSTLTVDYSYEEERIKSFKSWSIHYPIDPRRLAKAGFYYSGNEDEVICFSCHGHVKDWNYADIVLKKHATLFPDCDFVTGKSKNVPLTNTKNQSIIKSSKQNAPISDNTKYLTEILKHIDYDKMKSLNERVKTFETQWPQNNIDISKLAEAGFFYLGIEDKVQCPFCRGIVSSWEAKDEPFQEHKKHFPSCDYVSNIVQSVISGTYPRFHSQSEDLFGNMQRSIIEQSPTKSKLLDQDQEHLNLEQLGVHLYSSPAHPQQGSLSARLRSFIAWPETAVVSKEILAEAGFFYIGIGDHTKCFHCNGGLCNWELGDDPWVEHARWFCNCHFLRLNRGDQFVEDVLKSSVPESTEGSRIEDASAHFRSEPLLDKVNEAMNSSSVKYILESGCFSRDIVQTVVVRNIERTGSSFSDLNELCSAASCLKEALESYAVPEKRNSEDSPNLNELNIRMCTIAEAKGGPCCTVTSETQSESPPKKMKESFDCSSTKASPATSTGEGKTETPRDHLLCKICMDKEVGVVFLPCGHLLACNECSAAMELCPMCRQPIKATVKAFLS